MVILGIDAHERTHTVVAVDEHGRRLGTTTSAATGTADHLGLMRRAERFGQQRTWAVEDCRHLSRRLEADLLAAGERIVRVPPKLMAHSRDAARTYGRPDPIDALAVAAAVPGPHRQSRASVGAPTALPSNPGPWPAGKTPRAARRSPPQAARRIGFPRTEGAGGPRCGAAPGPASMPTGSGGGRPSRRRRRPHAHRGGGALAVTVTVEVTDTPDPHASRGMAWSRSREATDALTEGRREIAVPLGQDFEVGVELTWRARERTDRSVERLVATGEESGRVAVSTGSDHHGVGVVVIGATPVALPASAPQGP